MKKLTKKLVMLTVFGLSMGAVNAQVCSIGTDTYSTLDSALAAVPTGDTTPTTIKLLQNITQTGGMPQSINATNKNITFDLNAKTLEVVNAYFAGLHVYDNGQVNLTEPPNGVFNISAIYGVDVRNGSKATVTNVICTGTPSNYNSYGVYAQDLGSEVTILGDVKLTASDATGTGVGASNGAKVTVNGSITVPVGAIYIQVGLTVKTKADSIPSTTKPGYIEYTDGTSTVWVKNPSVTTYNITATAGTGGSISPSGTISVEEGKDTTFTFAANSGYEISQVLIDNLNNFPAVAAGTYTFTNVMANHKIEVYFTPSTGISEVIAEKMTIYPNPTTGQLRVSGDILDGKDREIIIFDVIGQVVFMSQLSKLSPETTIDISCLANGLYFLKVGGKVVKIVKE